MNAPHRPTEANFRSTVPFLRSGMRIFNGLGCSVSLLNTSHVIPKATWSSPWLELRHRLWSWSQFSRSAHCERPAGDRRCLVVRDGGTSRLDCASHLDAISLAANIFAPFGAVPRISRTARRMAHDLLCAALLLLGCLRPARAARLAIAALGICRASYLGLLLDAASSFSSTAARACLSSQHTARERTRPIPSRARGLFMLRYVSRMSLRDHQEKDRFVGNSSTDAPHCARRTATARGSINARAWSPARPGV